MVPSLDSHKLMNNAPLFGSLELTQQVDSLVKIKPNGLHCSQDTVC